MTKPLTAKHGTHGGVGIHRRLKEPMCDACKKFQKKYNHAKYLKNMEKAKAQAVKNYWANREHRLAVGKKWQQENLHKFQEYNRRYYKKNPSGAIIRVQRRKARIKGNGYEPYTLQQVLEYYGPVCYLCEEEIDLTLPRKIGIQGWGYGLHLDHVIPISKGGKDCLENVAPTHAICNLTKRGN